jgi:hypothetical protein
MTRILELKIEHNGTKADEHTFVLHVEGLSLGGAIDLLDAVRGTGLLTTKAPVSPEDAHAMVARFRKEYPQVSEAWRKFGNTD